MNDGINFEFFTEEELEALDKNLKKTEKIEIPEGLSAESIENLIKDVPQDEISEEPKRKKGFFGLFA